MAFHSQSKKQLEDWLVIKLSHKEMAQHSNLKWITHKKITSKYSKSRSYQKHTFLNRINITNINDKVRLFCFYIADI